MQHSPCKTDYALVTPAKNEEEFIERTLGSVIAQTVLPRRWVIVSDGSTDRTDEIVRHHAERHSFIKLVRRESAGHCFGSKVLAFQAGCDELHDVPYEFIGNLDADMELPEDYYERLLRHFSEDPKLGLAGGTRFDLHNCEFVKVRFNEINLGGAYQLFRRDCYEEIGGYLPLELGGEDTMAGVMARHRGWRVRAIEDIEVHHLRPTGVAQGNVIRAGFRSGRKRFLMGYHPLFECARLLRIRRPRQAAHNLCELIGFAVASCSGLKRQVPEGVVRFLRAEQVGRLKQLVFRFHDPASGGRDQCVAG